MSTPYTATSIIGARLADKLGPVLSPDLARVLDAIGAMCEPLADVIEDQGFDGEPGFIPSYGRLFDPELCPAQYLPFLGNFVGVSVPIGASETEARALIKAESGLERGTRASVESAIERNLAPGGAFDLIERRNLANEVDPYSFVVIVQGSKLNQSWFVTKGDWTEQTGKWESPATNTTGLEAAINRVKPAGLIWSLIVTEDHPWLEVTGSWESQTTTWALT